MHNGFKDRYRREIILGGPQVKNVLPDHFKSAYPKFISLLEKYYEFLDENDSTELLQHLFQIRDVTETDITLLSFIEDELLLGEEYFEGFTDKRAAANFSSILFRSKGSKYSIEWFFRSFFGIDAEVFYPKEDIFYLNQSDSKIGPDYEKYITDDKLYQTFALLVRASLPISQWREVFKLFVHPAGMYLGGKVLLQSVSKIDPQTILQPLQYNTPNFSFTSGSADEGSTYTVVVTQTVTASPAPPVTGSLFYYVQLGTAEVNDFITPPATDSTILQEVKYINNSGSLSFSFNDDNDYAEGDEIFTVRFYDHPDIDFANEVGTSTITIGNILPVYTMTLNAGASPTINEIYSQSTGGSLTTISGTMTTTHPNGFNPAFVSETVTLSLTGAAASDPRLTNLRWIDSGTTTTTMNSASKDFAVDFTGDDIYYNSPTFQIQATSIYATDNSDTITLQDSSAVYTIDSSDTTHNEGSSITFDVTVSNSPLSGSQLYWWIDDLTNMTSADFDGSPPIGETNRALIPGVINANGNSGPNTVTVTLAEDTIVESSESYTINIGDAASPDSFVDRVTINVVDNDVITYDLQLWDNLLRVGPQATSFVESDAIYGRVVVSASGPSETVTVRFQANSDLRLTSASAPSNNIITFTNTGAGNYDFTYAIPNSDVYQGPSAVTVEATSTEASDTQAITVTDVIETLVSVTGPTPINDGGTASSLSIDINPSNDNAYNFPTSGGTSGTGSQSYGLYLDGGTTVTINASIKFANDFKIKGVGNITPGSNSLLEVDNGTWATGVTSELASDYEIRATLNSSSTSSNSSFTGTFNSWLGLGTDRNWNLAITNSTGSETPQYSIQFEIRDVATSTVQDTFTTYYLGCEVDFSGGG